MKLSKRFAMEAELWRVTEWRDGCIFNTERIGSAYVLPNSIAWDIVHKLETGDYILKFTGNAKMEIVDVEATAESTINEILEWEC